MILESAVMTEERKVAKAARMKRWRDENADKRKEYAAEYRAKNPLSDEQKAQKAAVNKAWREKNADAIRAKKAAKRLENLDEMRAQSRASYQRNALAHNLYNLKTRAKKFGVPFNLTAEDIVTPEFCPVLGIKLERSSNPKGGVADCSPTVDRLIPELGYVKGNVIVVSHKANRIKNDATVEEIEAVARFYKCIFQVKELNAEAKNAS